MNRYYHYELLPWVKEHADKLNKKYLVCNPHAIDYIIENGIKIDWYEFNSYLEYISDEERSIYQNCKEWNKMYIDFMLKNIKPCFSRYLSYISDNQSIDTLIKNINKIVFLDNFYLIYIASNNNDRLTKYFIKEVNKQSCFSSNKYSNNYFFWAGFSKNNNDLAVDLLLANPDKIKWNYFSLNTNQKAIEFLKQNPDEIVWDTLSSNKNAIDILSCNINKINKQLFIKFNYSIHKNKIFQKINLETIIRYPDTSECSTIVKELIKNIDKIDIDQFNLNRSPLVIKYLTNNQHLINWELFSKNPSAIDLLSKNTSLIDWNMLSYNKNIFKVVYDYPLIRTVHDNILRNLMEVFYHPLRMNFEYLTDVDDSDYDYDKQFIKPVISVLKK